MKRILYSVILILLFIQIADAQEMRAFVDKTDIALGDSVQFTVSVSGGEGKVDVSPIQDFKVLYRGTSTNVQIVNGHLSRETSSSFTLIPLKEGHLVIPSLNVSFDNKILKTQEISIEVSKTVQQGDDRRQYLFVEGRVSNPEPYEGEPIIYTFKFFVNVRLANVRFQKPDFKGFTAKETVEKSEERKSYRSVVSGKEYNVTELSYILIPLSSGEKTIEPAVLEADLMIPRDHRGRRMDPFFNDPFFGNTELEPGVFKTETIKVNVKPLPPFVGNGKFSGLVGKFGIHAASERSEINVGDSVTLSITIEGSGNLPDMEEPQIAVPDAFKLYKDTPQDDIKIGESGYKGRKTFRMALVGMKEGQYQLEPISLNYFDPSENSYKTEYSQALSIRVNPAKEKDKPQVYSASSSDQKPVKQKVEFTGRDILPLKEDLDALAPQKSMSFQIFVILLCAPMIICILVKLMLIAGQKKDSTSDIMSRRAEKALREASKLSGDQFLSALYRALVSGILSKAGTKGESLTYSEARQILTKCGYSEEKAQEASMLLEKIESAKFGGAVIDAEIRASLLNQTRIMVKELKL